MLFLTPWHLAQSSPFWIVCHAGATTVMFSWQKSYRRERWRSKIFLKVSGCPIPTVFLGTGAIFQRDWGNLLERINKKTRDVWGNAFHLSRTKLCQMLDKWIMCWILYLYLLAVYMYTSNIYILRSHPTSHWWDHCSLDKGVGDYSAALIMFRRSSFVPSSHFCSGLSNWQRLHNCDRETAHINDWKLTSFGVFLKLEIILGKANLTQILCCEPEKTGMQSFILWEKLPKTLPSPSALQYLQLITSKQTADSDFCLLLLHRTWQAQSRFSITLQDPFFCMLYVKESVCQGNGEAYWHPSYSSLLSLFPSTFTQNMESRAV